MYPIIFNFGLFSLSSFGLFLSLSLLFGSFVIWRLANIYDLDQEKILDIIFLTFIAGLIGARIYYILLNYPRFDSLYKIILINRYPGLTFWGGLIFGILALYFLAKRFNFNFWLVADLAAVGLFLGLSLGSIGCLLSGCQNGMVSTFSLSVTQVGLIGKRFPIQVIYSFLYLIGFFILWGNCLRFHFNGKVATLGLLLLGFVTFILGFFRGDSIIIYSNISLDQIIASILFILGFLAYYHQGRRSFYKDLNFLKLLLTSPKSRKTLLLKLTQSWYNFSVNFRLIFTRGYKRLSKKLHVKSNPSQF